MGKGSGSESESKEKKHKDKKDKDKKDKKDKDKKDKDKDKDKKDKDKKDKDKKDKHKEEKHGESSSSHGMPPAFPTHGSPGSDVYGHHDKTGQQVPMMPQPGGHQEGFGGFPQPHGGGFPQPQGHGGPPQTQAPPSGYRIPLNNGSAFPDSNQLGTPPAYDHDNLPLYFASVLFERSVHPAKAGNHLGGKVAVSFGGGEQSAPRFDLLPFDPHTMELIPASHGQIPPGRRPIEGGYEEDGTKLYHAIAVINGMRVPGKAGIHLGGASVPYGGVENSIQNYELLVWRY